MTTDLLFVAIIVVMFGVVVILAIGIGTFGKGGKADRARSNRLMRYRLAAQFVAVLLILLFIFLRGG